MVIIQNTLNISSLNEGSLAKTLQKVLKDLGKENAELLLRLVKPVEIQYLNKTYRQQDKVTNVLSFPSELPPEIMEDILGDVVVCIKVVESEAGAQNKSFENHFLHIVVHGILHLLGYNHIDDKEALIMQDLEVEILQTLCIPNPYL
jgi:probable rRNA maturation factor